MKKNGFTLIELLSVTAVLGIVLSIAYVTIKDTIASTRTKAFIANEKIATDAARLYTTKEQIDLPEEGTTIGIDYTSLVTEGYIEPISDPNTNNECGGYVIIENIGNDEYTYTPALICETFESDEQFWSEWSAWQEEMVEANDNTEVESATFYNYRDESQNWSDWTDLNAYASDNTVINESEETEETRTVYRYQDTETKWYKLDYTTSYYSTAPAGYPNKDESQVSYSGWSKWCTSNPTNYDYRQEVSATGYTYKQTKTGYTTYYWTGCNPSGPQKWYSNSGWAQHTTTDDVGATYSGYTRQVYTYLGTRTVYRYRTLSWKWYNIEYYNDGQDELYSTTAPPGYDIQDATQFQMLDWVETETVDPDNYDFRDEELKNQRRTYDTTYGDPILTEYLQQEDFEIETNKTIEEVNTATDYDLLQKTMYRYRTNN